MRMSFATVAAATACCSLVHVAAAAMPVVANFDVDQNGFQAGTTSTTQIHLISGGNPNGFIQLRKQTGPSAFDLSTENMTTPAFLGNYGAGGINGAGFDLNNGSTDLTGLWVRLRDNTSVNGWYYDFGPVAANDTWKLYDVAFDPTWDDTTAQSHGWVQEAGAGSFAATLADVGWFEVRLLNPPQTSSLVSLDNIRLVPAPGAAAIALLGLTCITRRKRAKKDMI